MTAHTPGPWTFNPIGSEFSWLEGANGSTIFHVDPYGNKTLNAADAALMAAAPDMLEALKDLMKDDALTGLNPYRVEAIEAAIAKAEGKS
jgi:hypothetical protein